MKQQSIMLDSETTEQAKTLADKWGLPPQRHLSAVVSRAVERAYVEELTGLNIEAFSRLEDDEYVLLLAVLELHLRDIQQSLAQSVASCGREIGQQEADRLARLIGKLRR